MKNIYSNQGTFKEVRLVSFEGPKAAREGQDAAKSSQEMTKQQNTKAVLLTLELKPTPKPTNKQVEDAATKFVNGQDEMSQRKKIKVAIRKTLGRMDHDRAPNEEDKVTKILTYIEGKARM